jgi:hypothetical protein
MIPVLETAASYGPKSSLVLGKPASKHGSEASDRLVMTSAEQSSDLDLETARIRTSGRVLRYKKHRAAVHFLPLAGRPTGLLRSSIGPHQ